MPILHPFTQGKGTLQMQVTTLLVVMHLMLPPSLQLPSPLPSSSLSVQDVP